MAFGWAGTVDEFLASDQTATAHRLGEQRRMHSGDRASGEQLGAWNNELQWLSAALHVREEAREWGLILEYELPFEGGRRPDVVLLARDVVLVLESKKPQGSLAQTSIRSMPMHAISRTITPHAADGPSDPSLFFQIAVDSTTYSRVSRLLGRTILPPRCFG